MQKTPTMFLRFVVWAMGLVVLALSIFVLPQGIAQEWHTNLLPIVIALYATVVPFFVVLFYTLKLLNLIDKSKAFSEMSVNALSKIKLCAAIISAMYTLGLPYFYAVAQTEDAPGVMVIGLIFAGTPLVIAVFAAVLQKLLHSAIALQKENDLTV
jgi:hypothetical protein